MRRLPLTLLVAAVVAACWPAAAFANGDPASDILITDTVFLPYERPSADQEAKLRRVVDAARRSGRRVRVAVIHSPRDLGAVANLFGHPQEYANLLARELQNPVEPGFRGHTEGLLVVMPAGYGTKNVPAEAGRALRGVELPSNANPDELVGAAGWGVQELARVGGRPIREEFDKPAGESGGGALVIVLVVVGLTAVVAALVVVRMRSGEPAAAQSPGGNT